MERQLFGVGSVAACYVSWRACEQAQRFDDAGKLGLEAWMGTASLVAGVCALGFLAAFLFNDERPKG